MELTHCGRSNPTSEAVGIEVLKVTWLQAAQTEFPERRDSIDTHELLIAPVRAGANAMLHALQPVV
jgi:hypothetical protein